MPHDGPIAFIPIKDTPVPAVKFMLIINGGEAPRYKAVRATGEDRYVMAYALLRPELQQSLKEGLVESLRVSAEEAKSLLVAMTSDYRSRIP